MRIRSIAIPILLMPLVGACAPMTPPTLPDPDVDLGLGDVVLLTWTTRSPDGVLGHSMLRDVVGVDPHRLVVDGQARLVETSQKMRFLVTVQQALQGNVQSGVVGASAGISQVTHVAYDVHLTRYLELPPASLHYSAKSACCLGGEPSSSCGEWYVVRMMWGSGKVQYLQQVSTEAGLSATELVHARGGTTYRRLNEMSFDQAFFAYEAVPLEDLCRTVQPDDELAELTVRAPKNCWAMAQRADGTNAPGSWHVADAPACEHVVRKHCEATPNVISCAMTFGVGDQAIQSTISLGNETPQTPQ
ncbi:MAG: hypothetical protein QM784_33085 [Polyangiaceae bacterium]